VSTGWAALALVDARASLEALQVAAALSLEGFRANASPLDERVVAARPAPGQAACAAGLRELLAGGSGSARRLQDPLSFRCVSQTHGSLAAALEFLDRALEPELNGAGDNPLVLTESGEIVSTGNFFAPALTVALDVVALALTQVAGLACARVARLCSAPLTDLPHNLASPGSTGTGVAPLLKVADALAAEIAHRAAPATLAARGAGDGVEDVATGAPLAVGRLGLLIERLRLLVALELVVAAQAVDLAGVVEQLGRGTGAAFAAVRELAGRIEEDRPLGPDVEQVAAGLASVVAAARGAAGSGARRR
jgi:histidine ammonia-lyase